MSMQRIMILEITFYRLKLGHNLAEATQNNKNNSYMNTSATICDIMAEGFRFIYLAFGFS